MPKIRSVPYSRRAHGIQKNRESEMAVQCVRCGNWSGNGIVCEECERRSMEKALARNQCLHPGGITDNDGSPCCPFTWRPIETAPKDGRYILIWLGNPWGKIISAKWHAPWATWLKEVPGVEDCDRYGIGDEESTYWTPLPEPPIKK